MKSSSDCKRVLLLDGGVSTHLEGKLQATAGDDREGGNSFEHKELWSSSLLLNPQGQTVILEGHKDWIVAGCNLISTVTYQCHYRKDLWPPNVCLLQTPQDMTNLWHTGLMLARKAVVEVEQGQKGQHQGQPKDHSGTLPVMVVASLGCYGAALANGAEYTGAYEDATKATLMDFHRRKLQVVAQHQSAMETTVDGIAIETVPSILECHALVELLVNKGNPESFHKDLNGTALWISLSCRNASQLNDGTLLQDALQVLAAIPTNRVHAFGLNCCDVVHLPALVEILVRHVHAQAIQAKSSIARGIVLYPNSGEVWVSPTQTWKQGTGCTTPETMSQHLLSIVRRIDSLWESLSSVPASKVGTERVRPDLPRLILGGCCRTTPATMLALRQKVDDYLSQPTGDA